MNISSVRLLSTAMLITALAACSGDDGSDGLDGAQGPQGEQGAIGVAGDAGPQGPAGNDAFGGFSSHDISNMEVGESMIIVAPAWDAGTEANTETADTMPGPAAQAAGGGGEAAGTSPERDDIVDAVRIHSGVVTSANADDPSLEGLATSILDQSDRFDNPTMRVVVTRTR